MAPLKFEDSIKEKLEQRAITPSRDSWEQLANQMDILEKKKKYSNIRWYAIAASVMGIFILSSVFFNTKNTSVSIDPQVVDASNEELKETKSKQLVEVQNTKQESNIEETVMIVNPKSIQKKIEVVSGLDKDVISQKNTEDVASLAVKENKNHRIVEIADSLGSIQENQEIQIAGTLISDDNVAGVVAQIKELQKRDADVTEDEINELLLKAQQQMATQEIIQSNTVSASALLLDVETELDETFKNKVFEALKSGFKKVKTAVAEREN